MYKSTLVPSNEQRYSIPPFSGDYSAATGFTNVYDPGNPYAASLSTTAARPGLPGWLRDLKMFLTDTFGWLLLLVYPFNVFTGKVRWLTLIVEIIAVALLLFWIF